MASTNRDEISRLELLHAAHPDGLVFPHLADAYRRAGRYAQAESVLKAGLRRHSDYSSAHVVLGRLRLDQGKRSEAENAFQRVLQLDPENSIALELLGRMSAEEGRTREALSYLRRLAGLEPSDALDQQIEELEAMAREARRTEARRTGGEAQTGSRSTGNGGGDGWGAVLDPSRADRPDPATSEQPPEPQPPEPELPEPGEVVTETMAELYSRQGLHERAEAVYRALLRRDPSNARLRARFEDAMAAAGRGTEAKGAAVPSDRAAEWTPLDALGGPGGHETPVPQPAGPSIRTYLAGMLAWRADAGPRDGAASAAVEPSERPRARPRVGPTPTPEELGLVDFELEDAEPGSRALIALTDLLVGLLEYRDPFFRGSSSLTRLLALNVAEELGLGTADRVNLALAAMLRDLGRLAVGGRLVEAQKAATAEERRAIERHVDLALRLLEGIDLPRPVRLAVRHHHERWDGDGYPDGLAGTDIPFLARVLAVVDSFAAMISPRPYRPPRKVADAVRQLMDGAGRQYDPQAVDAIFRVLDRREQPRPGLVRRDHILVVDPDRPGAVVTASKLGSAGYLAEVSRHPDAARERLRRVPVAALVVSAKAGPDAILELIRELRLDPVFTPLPILVVDAETVDLRVRLLEGGADVCFPPGISFGELQGTLGALVRRTVRARSTGPEPADGDAPWLPLQGDVRDFPLAWLLQVMKYESRTAGVGLRTAAGQGVVYVEDGEAVHARVRGGERGEAALKEMLRWREGRFTVQPDARPGERSIESPTMHLLLTQGLAEGQGARIFGAVSD